MQHPIDRDQPRRRAKRLDRDARRAQLLAAATRLLAEEGPSALTMEGIAAEAEVAKTVVYRHFANRGEVLFALLELDWERMDDVLGTVDPAEDRTKPRLRAYFEQMAIRGSLLRALSFDSAEEQRKLERRQAVIGEWAAEAVARLGLAPDVAAMVGAYVIAGQEGAARQWLLADADRSLAEEIAVIALDAVARAVVDHVGATPAQGSVRVGAA